MVLPDHHRTAIVYDRAENPTSEMNGDRPEQQYFKRYSDRHWGDLYGAYWGTGSAAYIILGGQAARSPR